MTNFERIKTMSVMELAEFISSIHDTDIVSSDDKSIDGHIIPCYTTNDIKEWLESEVSDQFCGLDPRTAHSIEELKEILESEDNVSLINDKSNHCVSCGAEIPEGTMVCPSCERRWE